MRASINNRRARKLHKIDVVKPDREKQTTNIIISTRSNIAFFIFFLLTYVNDIIDIVKDRENNKIGGKHRRGTCSLRHALMRVIGRVIRWLRWQIHGLQNWVKEQIRGPPNHIFFFFFVLSTMKNKSQDSEKAVLAPAPINIQLPHSNRSARLHQKQNLAQI